MEYRLVNQRLVKLSASHYVVVDGSEIKDLKAVDGLYHLERYNIMVKFPDFLYDLSECRIITHSTIPIEDVVIDVTPDGSSIIGLGFDKINQISLTEVEEAIQGYSAESSFLSKYGVPLNNNSEIRKEGYFEGFKAHEDLVKDKFVLSKDDIKAVVYSSYRAANLESVSASDMLDEVIKNYSPKTEWDVCFDESGMLRLV